MDSMSWWKQHRKRLVTYTLMALGAVLLASGAIIAYRAATRPTSPMPPSVQDQLTFSPLVIPLGNKTYTTSEYKFTPVEDNVHVLTYRAVSTDAQLTVTEYPQPTQFTEVPEYKERFLSNVIGQYSTVQTANGTIYLGRPAKQGDKQVGVLLERGLLVFMQPDQDMDPALWRQFGDSLEIQKATP